MSNQISKKDLRDLAAAAVAERDAQAQAQAPAPIQAGADTTTLVEQHVTLTLRQAVGKRITFVKPGAKKPGSKAYARYCLYEVGMSPEAYVAKCIGLMKDGTLADKARNARADIAWDTKHGNIRIEG